jgi:hypothetical protein
MCFLWFSILVFFPIISFLPFIEIIKLHFYGWKSIGKDFFLFLSISSIFLNSFTCMTFEKLYHCRISDDVLVVESSTQVAKDIKRHKRKRLKFKAFACKFSCSHSHTFFFLLLSRLVVVDNYFHVLAWLRRSFCHSFWFKFYQDILWECLWIKKLTWVPLFV